MKKRKYFLIYCIFLLLLLTGCKVSEVFDAIDQDIGTQIGEIASSIEEYTESKQDISLDNLVEDAVGYITNKSDSNSSSELLHSEGGLSVHFLDVGQADCTLIICDDEAMLIDCGNDSDGTKIQNYLNKQNIVSLKYVIGTHPDADHIGGMDVILTKFDCKTVIMPEYEHDTKEYRDVIDTMKYISLENTIPKVGNKYSLGSAEFVILAPNHYEYGNETNNYSISLLMTYGDSKFLFTGDAEAEAESDILNNGYSLEADVYHVGHHGSSSSTGEAFLEAVKPSFAVISCGQDNNYGHPHQSTLNRLRAAGINVFRTDEQGTIIAVSDGSTIIWNCAPSTTWQSGW